MDVPFVDLAANYDRIRDDIDDRIAEVIETTQFIGGNTVAQFETNFAEYIGVDHAVGLASGTDALRLALEALGVGPGDEVVTVSHTFVSSVDAIRHNGATPRFVDIRPESYTMDPDAVRDAITADTAAILPVHLYGQPVDIEQIETIAADHDIPIVEDACQAHGASYDGTNCGQFGEIACYSFYPSKNLGAFGDGGMAVTDNSDIADRLRSLREYGSTEKYRHEETGYNSRLDAIQAAVLDAKLPHLDAWNAERRDAAQQYTRRLAETPLVLPEVLPDRNHVYHLYVVRTRTETERDELQAFLERQGISTGIHYPVPVHRQPSYTNWLETTPELPVTERSASRILSLPMYPEITATEIDYACDAIEQFYS